MRNKLLILLFLFFYCCTSYANDVEFIENSSVNIVINSKKVPLDSPVLFSDSSILFPLRNLSNALNIDSSQITWNPKERSVLLSSSGKNLKLYIDKKTAFLDTIEFELNVTPVIYKNQTYVPLRLIGEFFDCYVIWDQNSKTAFLKDLLDYSKTADFLEQINNELKATKAVQIYAITELKTSGTPYSFGNSIYINVEKNKIYEKNLMSENWNVKEINLSETTSPFLSQFSKILPCSLSIAPSLSDENQTVLIGIYPLENNLLSTAQIYIDPKTLRPTKIISETDTAKKNFIYSFETKKIPT